MALSTFAKPRPKQTAPLSKAIRPDESQKLISGHDKSALTFWQYKFRSRWWIFIKAIHNRSLCSLLSVYIVSFLLYTVSLLIIFSTAFITPFYLYLCKFPINMNLSTAIFSFYVIYLSTVGILVFLRVGRSCVYEVIFDRCMEI